MMEGKFKTETAIVGNEERQVCKEIQGCAMKLLYANRYCNAVQAVEHDFSKNKIWMDIADATLIHTYKNTTDPAVLRVEMTECRIDRDPWLLRVAVDAYLSAFATRLGRNRIEIESTEIRALHIRNETDEEMKHEKSVEVNGVTFVHKSF